VTPHSRLERGIAHIEQSPSRGSRPILVPPARTVRAPAARPSRWRAQTKRGRLIVLFLWAAALAIVAQGVQLGLLDMRSGSPGTHWALLVAIGLLLVLAVATVQAAFAFLALRPWAWWYGTVGLAVGCLVTLFAALSGRAPPGGLLLPIMLLVMLVLTLTTRSQFRRTPKTPE
jgi:hypothetical protein